MRLEPQAGYQEKFLSSQAEIVIGGSGAGVGKTFSLLMEAARNHDVKGYNAVIFRRTTPQIKNQGGLWEESIDIFPKLGGNPLEYKMEWEFPGSNAKIKFNHLQYEHNKYDHQGGQYAFLGFDEVTHFTESQFFYMLSRNRSKHVKPYCRATCNPDPDSWVSEFVAWWIDQDPDSPTYGLPIPERDGVIRYFTRHRNQYIWGNTKQEVLDQVPDMMAYLSEDVAAEDLVKSVTFISGDIQDNRELLKNNPEYLANLLAQDDDEKKRLLDKNWKVSQDATALMEFRAVEDLASNPASEDKTAAVSCDVARFGSDWAVIMAWRGLLVRRVYIWTKCDLNQVGETIEQARAYVGAGRRDCYVDVDGMGAGVVDAGRYSGFQNQGSVIHPPEAKRDENLKANFPDLKTQCFYHLADKVNYSEISFKDCEFFVDGVKTDHVMTKKGKVKVMEVFKKQLRAIRRNKPDTERRKQINSKADQKTLLGGASPDCADATMIRMLPLLKPVREMRVA